MKEMLLNHCCPMMIKLLIIVAMFNYFGFLLGMICIYLCNKAYLFFIYKAFGLIRLNGFETFVFSDQPRNRFNMIGLVLLDNFNSEQFKAILIEKAIKNIGRLQMKIVNKFMEYYWTSTTIEEATDRIKILSPFEKEEDIYEYIEQQLGDFIDIFKEIPYEMILIPYGKENKGAFIMKFDHVLSDGLGAVSLICSLANDSNASIYPKIMQMPRTQSILSMSISVALYPLYTLINLLYILSPNLSNTPLRRRRDSSGKTKFAISKSIDLNVFSAIRKKYLLTFNDVMMSVISITMKQHMSQKPLATNYSMKCMVPFGIKRLPNAPNEVQLSIDSCAYLTYLPLINDITEAKRITQTIQSKFNIVCLVYNLSSIVEILGSFFTYKTIGLVWYAARFFDLGLSNIPGPTKQLMFGDAKCTMMVPICSCSRGLPYMPLMSYNGKFRFVLTVDESCELDPHQFIKDAENVIESIKVKQE